MPIERVLVVDDEVMIRSFLAETLRGMKIDVVTAEDGRVAIDLLKREHFDLVISDMKMPGKSGMDVLKNAKALSPKTLVILITAYASVETAVEAMRQGAYNYLIKPFSPETVETLIEKASEHATLIEQNQFLKGEFGAHSTAQMDQIIAESSVMKKILTDVKKIAKSPSSVLITGESGTGKEVISHAIHALSERYDKPFIKVNCAAMPETLIESEFFGHEKGAYTGALAKRLGRFELANQGTLLLDEITEVPLNLQAKLLRVIQEQEFERIGGTKSIRVDVRLIATSNRNMLEALRDKSFREDLYYRLNVIPINLPSLRERKEDILPLAHYFLTKFCEQNRKKSKVFSPEAKELLKSYTWPGNIRELANCIERTVVLDQGDLIASEHLNLKPSGSAPTEKPKSRRLSLHEVEKEHILEILSAYNQNRTHAAKALGITVRTLRNKLKEYEVMKSRQPELF